MADQPKLTYYFVTHNAVIEICRLKGQLVGGPETTNFHGHIHECLERGILLFCLNLAEVEWMNSVGLGMLISAHKLVTDNEGKLFLCAIPDSVMATLDITRLTQVFTHYDTEDEAVRALLP